MFSVRKLVASAIAGVAASGMALAAGTSGGPPTAANHPYMIEPGQSAMGPGQTQMTQSGSQAIGPVQMQEMMRRHHEMMAIPGQTAMLGTPTLPGQDAFGAIQEIVQILNSDPQTHWSKVDLEALRQHLIDMNEVTLKADPAPKDIAGGLEIAVTGSGRTLVAIQRMIPAWVEMANGYDGWSARGAPLPNGELLTVTATNPKEVRHIRGLGFIGLLVSGPWHQPHHLAMAKGELVHRGPGSAR